MNTVESEWKRFESAVLPPNSCPAAQRKEMRRTFYAGAQAMFNLMDRLGDGAITEQGMQLVLEGIMRELKEFAIDVQTDRA